MTTNMPLTPWEEKVHGYLIWAVHLASQNMDDPAERNNFVSTLLLNVLSRWDR